MTPYDKIKRLCRKAGFSTTHAPWDEWHGPGVLGGQSAYDLAHELGHAAVCAPYRRRKPFFGLGAPGEAYIRKPNAVSSDYAIEEEMQASLLGILIERQTGGDHLSHFYDHSWTGYEKQYAIKRLRALKRKGLIKRAKGGYRWTGKLWDGKHAPV